MKKIDYIRNIIKMLSAIVSLHNLLKQQKKYDMKPQVKNVLEKDLASRKASADVVVENSLTNIM